MKKRRRRRRRIMVSLMSGVVLMLSLGVVALTDREGRDLTESPEPVVICPIPTAIVQASPGDCTRVFPGAVRASRRVELAFSVPGRLDQLNAEEGRSVRQGEVLARLDQRDYQYALDMATAKCENARRELARCSNLWSQGAITDVRYEDAQTTQDIASAELHMRQKGLEDTVLHAPFDGIVVRRYLENHEHVQAKQAVVSFQDISRIEVVIQIPERLIAHGGAAALQTLQVRLDADSERWFDAVVREHSAESDGITHTYDVVIALAPPFDLQVLPGMTAEVKARITESQNASQSAEGAMRIPAGALCRSDDGKSYVWVIDPAGGKAAKRAVETLELRGDSVEIRSGLHPDEHVAIAALHVLREGLLVRPMARGKEGLDG